MLKQIRKLSYIIAMMCFILLIASTISADGIEDFETGSGWPWSPWQGSGGTISSSYAHDGTYSINDPGWCYRTDVSLGNAGDSLSAWVLFQSDGRFYLGFAADSDGCWSFVVAPNTNSIIIQQNNFYGYEEKATTAYDSFTTNVWYKAVVEFSSSSTVTGKLYSSDGNTLLAEVSYDSVTDLPGGIAIRSFGTTYVDTIESNALPTNNAPTASFSTSETLYVNEEASFNASASSDSDGTIVNYSWDWTNDGEYDDYGVLQTHTYTETGYVNITLRVTDNEGATDTQTQQKYIYPEPTPPVPEASTLTLTALGSILLLGVIGYTRGKKKR